MWSSSHGKGGVRGPCTSHGQGGVCGPLVMDRVECVVL